MKISINRGQVVTIVQTSNILLSPLTPPPPPQLIGRSRCLSFETHKHKCYMNTHYCYAMTDAHFVNWGDIEIQGWEAGVGVEMIVGIPLTVLGESILIQVILGSGEGYLDSLLFQGCLNDSQVNHSCRRDHITAGLFIGTFERFQYQFSSE